MSITRKTLLGAVTTIAVAGLAFGLAPAAQANPAPGTNPVIDLFGSDTTQDVSNGFADVIKDGSGNRIIASYDATSVGTSVTPGEVAPTVTVPVANGSSQGKTLLTAAIDGTSVSLTNNGTTLSSSGTLSRDDVEVARSSSAGSWDPAGRFAYIPFAVDAVTYATASTTSVPNGVPLGTSVGQDSDSDGVRDLTLRNIYGYDKTATTVTLENSSNVAFTVGAQGSGANIIPFVPQAGSGTRSFWQSSLGLTTVGFADRVKAAYGASNTSVQEHDGSVLAAVPNALVPFSIAQHIAQSKSSTLSSSYGITVTDRRNGAVLRSVGSASPTNLSGNLNSSFPINRAVFNVVENNAITSGSGVHNPTLNSLFVGSSAQILTAKRPGSATVSVINDFGFGTIPASGITPLDGQTYVAGTPKRAN